MKRSISIIAILLLAFSCGDQKIDTTKARQEMEAREIKRVSEGEIVEKALSLGNEDIKKLELRLNDEQQYELNNSSDINANFGFVSFDQTKQFDGKKFQVFDAYAYNAENELSSEPSVQILEGDTILLYANVAKYEGLPVGVFYIEYKRKALVLSIDK